MQPSSRVTASSTENEAILRVYIFSVHLNLFGPLSMFFFFSLTIRSEMDHQDFLACDRNCTSTHWRIWSHLISSDKSGGGQVDLIALGGNESEPVPHLSVAKSHLSRFFDLSLIDDPYVFLWPTLENNCTKRTCCMYCTVWLPMVSLMIRLSPYPLICGITKSLMMLFSGPTAKNLNTNIK